MRKVFKVDNVNPKMICTRQTQNPPSRVTPGGNTNLKPTKVYTGENLVGISIIHKSCLQPVFSKEAATDAATMRR